jgi:hypothetical protein
MEYEHESTEQTFARFYANALTSEVINSNPKIAAVFETWRKNGKRNSKLEENEYITRHILAGLGHLAKLNADDGTKAKID